MYTFNSPQKTHQFGSSIIAQHFPLFLGYKYSALESVSHPSKSAQQMNKSIELQISLRIQFTLVEEVEFTFFFKVRLGIIIQGF